MLRKIRVWTALFCFAALTLLFFDFTGVVHHWFGWIAKIQFMPALLAMNAVVVLALVALTFVLGRVYCSTICPLGVMQDIVSWFAARRKRNRFSWSPALNRLRYAVLALFCGAFLIGVGSIVALLSPYSAYGRIASNLFAPFYKWGNNILAYFAERFDSYAFYSVEVWLPGALTFAVAVATFAILAYLAWKHGRTYCNTVCPVGTILGIVSRFSLFKPVIDVNRCNGCKKCARNCKAACINPDEHRIDYSRCVVCMDCIDICSQKAINFTAKRIAVKHKVSAIPDSQCALNIDSGVSRRKFVSLAVFAGISSIADRLKAQQSPVAEGGLADLVEKQPPVRTAALTPAGSHGARHFARHCTGCQLCVTVCPTQVLRPLEDGLLSFMQPTMSYERGYCRHECTKCSEVCPTGAIHKITQAEKSSIQIGHAVWNSERCVVNTDKQPCDNCFRHCPTGAITMIDKPDASEPQPAQPWGGAPKKLKIPVIDIEHCIGCGACEHLCPSNPLSAIYVEGHLMHRTI
jgi:ferredoxin